jgi:hypothetical protein
VTAVQATLSNSTNAGVTLTGLTATGSTSGITGVTVIIGGTVVYTGTSMPSSISFSPDPVLQTTTTLQILVDISNTGSNTVAVTVTGLSGVSSNNGQAASITGVPAPGYTILSQQASATTTNTPIPTATATFVSQTVPIAYPNPSNGTNVSVLPPACVGATSVRVQIYTLAFRKVYDKAFKWISSEPVLISNPDGNMVDTWGNPLASGLYYVVTTHSCSRTVGKMLILR